MPAVNKNFNFGYHILQIIREEIGNPLQYSCLKNTWTEEPGGLLSIGSHRVVHTEVT